MDLAEQREKYIADQGKLNPWPDRPGTQYAGSIDGVVGVVDNNGKTLSFWYEKEEIKAVWFKIGEDAALYALVPIDDAHVDDVRKMTPSEMASLSHYTVVRSNLTDEGPLWAVEDDLGATVDVFDTFALVDSRRRILNEELET